MRSRRSLAAIATGALAAWPAAAMAADESSITLASGPGLDRVQATCSMCHSLDYIVMNSPFLDRAGWDKTVNKMVTVFGAPLTAEEAAEIAGYLDRQYGRESPQP